MILWRSLRPDHVLRVLDEVFALARGEDPDWRRPRRADRPAVEMAPPGRSRGD